jgi:phosphopentomutase
VLKERPMIKRIVLMVLDSVGVGELPDAALYGMKAAIP